MNADTKNTETAYETLTVRVVDASIDACWNECLSLGLANEDERGDFTDGEIRDMLLDFLGSVN